MKYSILLLLFLTACSSQFREPVCTNYLTSFPEEFKGSYELTMPTNSAEWSGNFILKTNRVEIIDKTTDFSEAMKGMPGSGALCKINNRYFTEVQNANGTYSLTEVVPFPQGLLFSALQLDIDKAHQQGLKLHYFPAVSRAVQDASSNNLDALFTNGIFVLDNRNIPLEQILSVIKPISMQVILRKVSANRGAFKSGASIQLKAPKK